MRKRRILVLAHAGYLWVGLFATAFSLHGIASPTGGDAWFTVDYGTLIILGFLLFGLAFPTQVVAVGVVVVSLYATVAWRQWLLFVLSLATVVFYSMFALVISGMELSGLGEPGLSRIGLIYGVIVVVVSVYWLLWLRPRASSAL